MARVKRATRRHISSSPRKRRIKPVKAPPWAQTFKQQLERELASLRVKEPKATDFPITCLYTSTLRRNSYQGKRHENSAQVTKEAAKEEVYLQLWVNITTPQKNSNGWVGRCLSR
jgi:hypothetical protein